ncbi:MAG: DEAD/DEAH box helicase, partial [Ilumatobacteraceae bacterium]
MAPTRTLESAIWSIADGRASDDDLALLHADAQHSLVLLERMIVDAEDDVASVRRLAGDERDQVLADFTDTLQRLLDTAALLLPEPPDSVFLAPEPEPFLAGDEFDDLHFEVVEPGEVELHATWHTGQLVVWAGGRGVEPESHDELSNRLEKAGGPPHGWEVHKGVPLPDGGRADALSITMKDALGWLVAVGGGQVGDGVGASVAWLGHVALEGVRLVVRGSVVPTLKVLKRPDGNGPVEAGVRWVPALTDSPLVDELVPAMPLTVTALGGPDARAVATQVIGAVVETIVGESIERMELPAQPPNANTPTDLNDTIIARMDGDPFRANANLATDTARRLEQWTRGVLANNRKKLVVELDPPENGGVWVVSVKAPAGKGRLIPIDVALRTEGGGATLNAEWIRLGRLFPALDRAGIRRRGQVALSQDEAWDFMTTLGPTLSAAGFDVRVPAMSRKKAKPSLRLFADTLAGSVVGAHQLANVAWTVLFDDLELTVDQVRHLARQAKPLVQSNGKWVEVDRADLEKAAAALEERAGVTTMTGAEILRASIGLDGSGLSGGTVVHGNSWAADILAKAGQASLMPEAHPDGFSGELRTYQAEALGWLGFLDAAELGGCLALDMGLGKTPTMLAHLARCRGNGAALVVAPAAVVGNWASEARKFVPGMRVVVHHGADRASDDALQREISRADIVITTYATAVRDVDDLSKLEWGRIVLDEAQAIKNPTNDTSQQLRRVPARSRIALTGTPIENGLG